MRIEEGRFYKTRDGRKVGPMKADDSFDEPAFIEVEGNGCGWSTTGVAIGDRQQGVDDLVAEFSDNPLSPPPVGEELEAVAWMLEWQFKRAGDEKKPASGLQYLSDARYAEIERIRLSDVPDIEWVRLTPLYSAATVASLTKERDEAREAHVRASELLTAAVDDYNDARAEIERLKAALRGAEFALVEASIPLEAIIASGIGGLSIDVWNGVGNAVSHVRRYLDSRAASRTLQGSDKP